MTREEIRTVISKIIQRKFEGQDVELKSSKEGNSKTFYDTLSSMSNASGGLLIFGIDEKNNYEVCGVKNVSELYKMIQELCKDMEPPLQPEIIDVEYYPNVFVICVVIKEVPEYLKPVFYKKLGINRGSFIRVGESDELMNEYEIFSYQSSKANQNAELEIFPELNLEESINKISLDAFIAKEIENKPNFSNLSKDMILKMLRLYNNDEPTLCCALCFGNYPQYISPMLLVHAVKIKGNNYLNINETNSPRFIASETIGGNISQMFSQTLRFIRNNINKPVIIDKNGDRVDKYEYPLVALRELLMNALLHRDYSRLVRNIPISVIIYDNRIEITNPGGLLGGYKVEDIGKEYLPIRNPNLVMISEEMMNTENRHSGINAATKAMKDENLLPPFFEVNRGYFKVTLFNGEFSNKKLDLLNDIIEYCRVPRSKSSIANKFGYSEDKSTYFFNIYVKDLIDKGMLKYLIPEKPKSKNQRIVISSYK